VAKGSFLPCYFLRSSWINVLRRDGQTGLSNDNTADINNYKTGVEWIESQLNSGHLTDNEAFYYDVPAI
jgi:hypothetical protein